MAITGRSASKTLPFGNPFSPIKDNLYYVEADGNIFSTTYAAVTEPACRHTAMIVVSAGEPSFSIAAGGTTQSYHAAVIKPLAVRCERAEQGSLIAFHLYPTHPDFPRFRNIKNPGVLALDRNVFRRFDAKLDALYHGRLSAVEASDLFNEVVATVLPLLPRATSIDRRIAKVVELVTRDHNSALDELAQTVNLSYFRLSRLFTRSLGMSLRHFSMWIKAQKAGALFSSGLSIAEIASRAGFADSAHMCRTFYQLWSAPPSYFLNNTRVNVHCFRRAVQSGKQLLLRASG